MIIAEFVIYPLDKGISLSPYVAEVSDIIDESGINYLLTPMGTILEGEWEDIIPVVEKCYRALEKKSDRISLSLKMDIKKGKKGLIDYKIKTVKEKAKRNIKSV